MCFVTGETHFSLAVITNLHLLGEESSQDPSCYVFNSSEEAHDKVKVMMTLKSFLKFVYSKENRATKVSSAKFNHLKLVESGVTLPKQPNRSDCGVYALQFSEEICIGLSNVANIRNPKYAVKTEDFCTQELAFDHNKVVVCFFVYFNSNFKL
jgi:Ulp1 family protease